MEQELKFRSDMTVELRRSQTDDAGVVEAARVSTKGEESRGAESDAGLINYLMRDRHGSPFEHNSFTWFVSAPIFVFREFQRHRIASYNEESGRYKKLEPVFYLPNNDRPLVQEGKPGAYEFVEGEEWQKARTQEALAAASTFAYEKYEELLNCGVAREVARMALPLNIYSSMYVTVNARSLMNFLSLRRKVEGSHFPSFPQREIEMCAELMEADFARLMPATHKAFEMNGRVAP